MLKPKRTKKQPKTYPRPPKERPVVSFETLIGYLKDATTHFYDPRTGTNVRYELTDVVCGTFSVFFTQCPSFLEHQQSLEQKYGLSNAQTLFGIQNIPSDTHIRTLMDYQSSSSFAPVFDDCLSLLKQTGKLDSYRVSLGGQPNLLCALDGTQYFESASIHCMSCSITVHKKGGRTTKSYAHTMVTPTLVAPDTNTVISLLPEFVTPQDGTVKQDCEIKDLIY